MFSKLGENLFCQGYLNYFVFVVKLLGQIVVFSTVMRGEIGVSSGVVESGLLQTDSTVSRQLHLAAATDEVTTLPLQWGDDDDLLELETLILPVLHLFLVISSAVQDNYHLKFSSLFPHYRRTTLLHNTRRNLVEVMLPQY